VSSNIAPAAASTVVAPRATLSRWERGWIIVVGVLFLLHVVNVEIRSVFLQRRMNDLGVYLRAAWAVRTGHDLYAVTDNNGWHYVSPPLLAIVLTPLADAPAGEPQNGVLPWSVSVVVWHLLSVLCAIVAAHWLATALERTSTDVEVRSQKQGCWRWWAVRF